MIYPRQERSNEPSEAMKMFSVVAALNRPQCYAATIAGRPSLKPMMKDLCFSTDSQYGKALTGCHSVEL